MKLHDVINDLGADDATRLAAELAREQDINWDEGACFMFSAIANDIERAPGNIGGKNDCERAVIEKWLKKYQRGYDGKGISESVQSAWYGGRPCYRNNYRFTADRVGTD